MRELQQIKGNSVSSIIEKLSLSRRHYIVVLIAALGFLSDSFDTYIVTYAMPVIIKEWHITPMITGMLTSAGMWGMMAGSLFWGPVTDRFGRKFGFMATLLGFSLMTGFTALAQNPMEFGVLRFLTGFCIGGAIPVDTALVSEYAPTQFRGRFISILTVTWPFGLLLATLASLSLVEAYGWRILFCLGALPLLVVVLAYFHLPESPRWLITKGHVEKARGILKDLGAKDDQVVNLIDEKSQEKVPVWVLFKAPYKKRFLLTTGYYFFAYFGWYGFALWTPTILATVFGLSLAKTFMFSLFGAAGAIGGRLLAFYTIERFGRKQLFYVGYGLAGIAALIFGLFKDPMYAVAGVCAIFFLCEYGGAGPVVYTAELYPSKVRATATSWSTSAGRLGSASSPILYGYLMGHQMYYWVFVAMAGCLWIAISLVFFMGIETKGKTLDDIGSA